MYLTKKHISSADQHIELNVSDDPKNPIYYRELPVYEKLIEILNTAYRAITYLDGVPIEERRCSLVLNNVDELSYMVNILVKDHETNKRWAKTSTTIH